ncbi:MAG TPA: hypothetical protein VHO28_06145 [Ignavibacteriales bacterium]|nr:hypothetical protein [Ignavibacteriales bacterium]
MKLFPIVVDILIILTAILICYIAAFYIAGIFKRWKTAVIEEKAAHQPVVRKPKFIILNNSIRKDYNF